MTASADIGRVADQVARYPEQAVRRAVDTFRKAIRPRLRADTGGDSRMSGIGNARLRDTGRVQGAELVEGRVSINLRGPGKWLDGGVRPHDTAAGVHHPGTDGLGTFSEPVAAALPDVEADLARDFEAVIR